MKDICLDRFVDFFLSKFSIYCHIHLDMKYTGLYDKISIEYTYFLLIHRFVHSGIVCEYLPKIYGKFICVTRYMPPVLTIEPSTLDTIKLFFPEIVSFHDRVHC